MLYQATMRGCKSLYQEFYKTPGQTAVSVLEKFIQAYAKNGGKEMLYW